jgi:hypothetical protein
MKKLDSFAVEKKIQESRPFIKLDHTTYKNVRTPALFIDAEYGTWWTCPHGVVYGGQCHPARGAETKRKKKTKHPQDPIEIERLVQADRPWISMKKETFEGFCKSCLWVDSQYGEFKLSPHAVLIRGSQHFSRSKTHPAEKVAEAIKKIKPHLTMDQSTYKNKQTKTKFIDIDYGEVWLYPHNLLQGQGDHEERLKETKIIPLPTIIEQLPSHVKIIESTYQGTSLPCQFIDQEHGEFEGLPQLVIDGSRSHPRRHKWTKQTAEDVQSKISSYIELIPETFEGMAHKAKFIDEKYGEFEATPADVVNGHGHRQRGLDKIRKTPDALISFLKENIPHVALNLDSYKGETVECEFIDSEYGSYKMVPRFLLKGFGLHPQRSGSSLERLFSKLMDLPRFDRFLSELPYKPDFKLTESLFVDVDGLFYHSSKYKEPAYHFKKRLDFETNNLRLIFFREDEVRTKASIVRSMCRGLLGLNKKIGARKCSFIEKVPSDFFIQNHLMGSLQGVSTLGLMYEGRIVVALSYRMKGDEFWIERFCNEINCTVVGALSKLLKQALSTKSVSKVCSYVDLRYGTGDSLVKTGFRRTNVTLGWKWTDGTKTYNRLQCRANMDDRNLTEAEHAEERGWFKIHDAGQALYVKDLQKTDS